MSGTYDAREKLDCYKKMWKKLTDEWRIKAENITIETQLDKKN